jgi:hypothetical protein
MRVNDNDVVYQEMIALAAAQVSPRLVTASTTIPSAPFDLADAKELIATLNIHEFLITALTGSNNDLAFIEKEPGDQSVTIAFIDPGANNAQASVVVVGSDITLNLATGSAGAITTTAAQAKALLESSAPAAELVTISFAPGNDGSGVLTALAQTPLAGPLGTNPTLDVKLQSSIFSGRLFDVAAFPQATAVGIAVAQFLTFGSAAQWILTLGGTATPVFAISIDASYRP